MFFATDVIKVTSAGVGSGFPFEINGKVRFFWFIKIVEITKESLVIIGM